MFLSAQINLIFFSVSKLTRFVTNNQFSGQRQPERVADHLPPLSDESENALNLIFLSAFSVEQKRKARGGGEVKFLKSPLRIHRYSGRGVQLCISTVNYYTT